MEISEKIKLRRKQLGFTQVDLANRVNISQTQISKYELGVNLPTADILVSLARVLHTSLDWLTGLSDEVGEFPGDEELSDSERQLVQLYRSKSPEQQERFMQIVRML